ncbi:hypothetical protein DFH09DRAFT_127348 [Mycena vulgaris]|nr:hypothetical protein DFH09DRAFT_127348 [Mycena vulgaris]
MRLVQFSLDEDAVWMTERQKLHAKATGKKYLDITDAPSNFGKGSGGWGNKNLRGELSSARDGERREQKGRCHNVTRSGKGGMLLRGSPSTLSQPYLPLSKANHNDGFGSVSFLVLFHRNCSTPKPPSARTIDLEFFCVAS